TILSYSMLFQSVTLRYELPQVVHWACTAEWENPKSIMQRIAVSTVVIFLCVIFNFSFIMFECIEPVYGWPHRCNGQTCICRSIRSVFITALMSMSKA